MADLNRLVDELSNLTVLEAAELSKLLEEKWGVSAAAAMPIRVAAASSSFNSRTSDIISGKALRSSDLGGMRLK